MTSVVVMWSSGMTAVRSPRFAAPWGQQICDLRFDSSGRLTQVVTCRNQEKGAEGAEGTESCKACTIQM